MLRALNSSLINLNSSNRELHKYFLAHKQKRGLLNLGGSFLKGIFGVMDDVDAEHIEKEITKLKDSDKEFSHILQKQTTILKNTIDTVRNITEDIQQKYVDINILIGKVHQRDVYQQLVREFEESSLIITLAINELQNLQSNILSSIFKAKHGKMDLKLIHPDPFMRVLERIQFSTSEFESPIKIATENFFKILSIIHRQSNIHK